MRYIENRQNVEDVNPTTSIVTWNANGLNNLSETEIDRLDKKKTRIQLYAVYKRHITDSKIQTGQK